MPKAKTIPRTAAEADKKKLKTLGSADVASAQKLKKDGLAFSKSRAKAGDIAWIGPCEPTGTRVVCYFDRNGDPSDCRDVAC